MRLVDGDEAGVLLGVQRGRAQGAELDVARQALLVHQQCGGVGGRSGGLAGLDGGAQVGLPVLTEDLVQRLAEVLAHGQDFAEQPHRATQLAAGLAHRDAANLRDQRGLVPAGHAVLRHQRRQRRAGPGRDGIGWTVAFFMLIRSVHEVMRSNLRVST
ncbi:MAG: hypothetical protein QM749_16955 [Aquabacterium sp.]